MRTKILCNSLDNLKLSFTYLILFLLVASCESEPTKTCITNSHPRIMSQLKISYSRFLESNKFENTNTFLETYAERGIGPGRQLKFDKQDKSLVRSMQESNFLEYAYEIVDYNTYWAEKPEKERNRRIEQVKKERPNGYAYNPKSDFYKCLNEMGKTDSVAYHYAMLIDGIGIPSSAALSSGLLRLSERFEGNQETIEWITIIHLYYPLLRGYL